MQKKKILLIPFCVTSTNRIICKYILHSFVIMFKKLKLRRKNIFRCAVKFKSRLQRFVSDVRTVPYTGKLRILIKSISVLYEKCFVSTEHSTTLGNNIFVYADYEKDTIWKSNMTHKTLDMDILLFSKFYVCRFGHPFMISRYTR